MASPLRLAFFDIETAPLLAHVWRAHDNYIDPDRLKHETFMLTWAVKFSDSPVVFSSRLTPEEAERQDDSRVVASLAGTLRHADILVAHNGDRFDLPVLNGRLLLLGLDPLGPQQTIDTLKLARRSFKVSSNRLDHLAKSLGLGAKHPTSFDLWERCYQGDPEALVQMDRYCRNDVRLLERVYRRILPYVKGVPRLQEAEYRDEFCCPYCGSGSLQRRGVQRTAAATRQRYQCQECLRWSSSPAGERQRLGLRA